MLKTQVPAVILECHSQCLGSIAQFPPKLQIRDLVHIKDADSFGCVIGVAGDEDHGDNWSYLVLSIDEQEVSSDCAWFDFEQLEKVEFSPTMTFDNALKLLKNGTSIRRDSWPASYFIFMPTNEYGMRVRVKQSVGDGKLPDECEYWEASQEAVLAEDWVKV